MDSLYTGWVHRWQAALDACRRKGDDRQELSVGPPASFEAIVEIEAVLGQSLPTSFRRVLLEFSAQVNVSWHLPDDIKLLEPCRGIFCGNCSWSLSEMKKITRVYQEWVVTFPNVADRYDVVWHDKLAFADVPNGDQLAFDLKFMPDPPVVYLSHDDGEAHGYLLGNNFIDFMERWSLLGCPGNEDWQMMPFLPDAASGLDAHGENARKWRKWFGLDFEVNKP